MTGYGKRRVPERAERARAGCRQGFLTGVIMAERKSRTQNTIINIITGTGGKLLDTILKFVVRTIFIHTLGKAYLGINGLFFDILTMLSLTELGIDTALNFQLYKPLAEGNSRRVCTLMKFYKQAYRMIGFAILVIGLCIIPLLPHLIKDYATLEALKINAVLVFILYLLESVSTYLFGAYRSALLKANQKNYIVDIADCAVSVLSCAVQIVLLVLTKDFLLFTVGCLLMDVFRTLLNAYVARRFYPQFFDRNAESLKKDEIRELFKDCGALFVYKVYGVVLKATDNLVISAFLGLTWVALYSNYLMIYNTIRSFLNQLYNAAKASMGNLFATETTEKKYRFFQMMNFVTALFYGLACVGVAVCANELIENWIGTDYVIPQPFPILIGVEILFHGLKQNLRQIRHVSGIFRKMWFRPMLGIIINLAASVILVNICGVYGVIIGTIIADLLTNFLVDPLIIHRYSFENYKPASEYYKKTFLYLLILGGVMALNLWFAGTVKVSHGWVSLGFHVLVVILSVFTVFTLLFRKTQECRYLLHTMKKAANIIMKRKQTGEEA